jgi:hypothetical protein
MTSTDKKNARANFTVAGLWLFYDGWLMYQQSEPWSI